MNKSLYTVLAFVNINTRRFFRDKLAIFFTIGFPLIFLFVFGGLNSGSGDISMRVAIINNSDSQFAKDFVKNASKGDVLKVEKDVKTLSQAKDKMTKSQIDATIILPKNFGDIQSGQQYPSGKAEVQYTQNNQSSGQALSSILSAQFKAINSKFVQTETPFVVTSNELKQKSLSPFDYAFAGLLGFAIIGMGIFGPVNVFPELKKMGILRRLSTTPLKVWQYFLSTMIGQAIVGLLALFIMFIVAILVFHLKVVGNYVELVLFLIFSITLILGIGLALGGWAKNERQAAPLTNIIVFPMMFLSGTFFPRFLMPEWLQNISAFLPLTPVIDGIRLITTEGKHLFELGPQIGLMAIWMVVIYAIAFKVFRWE
ncbi:MAG: ABC transporter permease [Candidatus Saccharibacteria bacterium]|nr:ABC transporter permease [Candidatus Saccharibacteria bacterium]